ncbi:hypothetical protein [Streptomyces sp. NBC_00057]|uniref:hypothetical protein n=1 Tax=Streptomyces sp. NBC_00057 TaxID=2975634 RepID=UPI003249235A
MVLTFAGPPGVAQGGERVGEVDVVLLLAVPEPGVGPLLAAELFHQPVGVGQRFAGLVECNSSPREVSREC